MIYIEDADLYEAAFSWDVAQDVQWLIERLDNPRTVLEPFCGSGRLFPAFAQRSVRVLGVDRSEHMAARARAKLESLGLPPTILLADTTDFDLAPLTSEPIDGAVCPINSLSYLTTEDLTLAHLRTIARHLRPGAKYLIQLDIITPALQHAPSESMTWDINHAGRHVRTTWRPLDYNPDTRIETQESRIEVISGPDAGRVAVDTHTMLMWDWPSWLHLIDASPFTLRASYHPAPAHRNPIPPDPPTPDSPPTPSAWHELVLSA